MRYRVDSRVRKLRDKLVADWGNLSEGAKMDFLWRSVDAAEGFGLDSKAAKSRHPEVSSLEELMELIGRLNHKNA